MAGVSWGKASLMTWPTAMDPKADEASGFPSQMEKLGWDIKTGEFLSAIITNWSYWWLVTPACSVPHRTAEKPSPMLELQAGAGVVCSRGECRGVWAERDRITVTLSPSPQHSCCCQDPFPALPHFEKNVKSGLISLRPFITYDSSDQKQGPLTALVFNACIHLWVEGSLSVWLMSSQHIPLTKNMKRFDFFSPMWLTT